MKTLQSRPSAYTHFDRSEWSTLPASTVTLSEYERKHLPSLNETFSEAEVSEIYLPLSQLLYMHMTHSMNLHRDVNSFLRKETKKVPFVIGIAGSVSVGKSTTARLIQALASRWPNRPKVDLITTDGFLYPNRVLEANGLMKRKGFPESYDITKLIQFLMDIKSGSSYVEAPVYSHLIYDVLPDQVQVVREPDVVIVEGINVLQVNKKNREIPHLFVSDFFDFSIYVDAEETDIIEWYIDRFKLLQTTAFQQPESYFHKYRNLSDEEATNVATEIWTNINGLNLEKNILPTKHRADLILKKAAGHKVTEISLKKR